MDSSRTHYRNLVVLGDWNINEIENRMQQLWLLILVVFVVIEENINTKWDSFLVALHQKLYELFCLTKQLNKIMFQVNGQN